MQSISKKDVQMQLFSVTADIVTTILYLDKVFWDEKELKALAKEWRAMQDLKYKITEMEFIGTKSGRA